MSNKLIKDIIQWDVKAWSKAIDYWEQEVDWTNISNALDLGARQGGLSLWLSQKGIKVTCSDLEYTERTARPLHEKYNATSNIVYEDIDANNIPYENHFDLIVFKSIIGGIGNTLDKQKALFDQMFKALKPNGTLIFAENMTASPLHSFLRKRFIKWGTTWRYIDEKEYQYLLKDFSNLKIKTTGFASTLGRKETQRNFLAMFDKLFFNYVVPRRWRYIAIGVARK